MKIIFSRLNIFEKVFYIRFIHNYKKRHLNHFDEKLLDNISISIIGTDETPSGITYRYPHTIAVVVSVVRNDGFGIDRHFILSNLLTLTHELWHVHTYLTAGNSYDEYWSKINNFIHEVDPDSFTNPKVIKNLSIDNYIREDIFRRSLDIMPMYIPYIKFWNRIFLTYINPEKLLKEAYKFIKPNKNIE